MLPCSLDDLIALALDAGGVIMAARESGFDSARKADGSEVTSADRQAEDLIAARLGALAPATSMIGEEAVSEGRIPERADAYFCVDALDGTRSFVSGGDEFTVNIAYIEHGIPIAGVIYAPATGEFYAGEPGRAVRRETAGAFARIAIEPNTPPTLRVIASRRWGANARTKDFIAALGPHALINVSSSIKLCRLAEGAADLYPRFGDVNEWDIAAGHAILRAAGGDILTIDGAPLRYGRQGGSFLIHGFMAYGSATVADLARAALKR